MVTGDPRRVQLLRQSRDPVADVWGERAVLQGEGSWPERVDELLSEEPERWVQSACVLCSNGCGLDIGVKDNRIVGVRGRAVDKVNRGRLGPKGLHGWQANASPDRLTHPLIRQRGKLQEASWDEAMELIVSRSKALIRQFSGSSIGFYTSGQFMLEEYYTLSVIGKAGIGTPHMDGNTRLCTATAADALKETFGSDGQPGGYADIDVTDCLLMVGHNMAETDTVLWMKVLDRRRGPNPPKLIVIDIRASPTAQEADVHLAPKPGTNVAVLNGLLHLILNGGGVDREFVAAHTIGFEDLAKMVADYTPEHVEELTGIPAAKLREAGRILTETRTLLSTVLQGVYQSNQATAAAVQVNNINLVRGLIGKPGSGILQMNGQPTAQNTRECGADGDLPGFRNWDNPEHVRELAELWNVEMDTIPHWSPPTHAMEIFHHAEKGSIKMLWISGTNPAVSLPDLTRIRSILSNPNLFVIVNDAFPTETTALADVVLPAALWGEKTGAFTNVDRTVHLSYKAVEPPGQARSEFDIFLDYARRMDFRDRGGQPLIKWSDPEAAFEAWKACSKGRPCDYTGLSYAKLTGGSGISWPCNAERPEGSKRLYEDYQFPTSPEVCETFGHDLITGGVITPTEYKAKNPAGKAILKPAPYLPPHESPDHNYPYWLSTGRLVYHFHTRTKTGRARALYEAAPDAYVEVSEADATSLHVKDGDWVRVESRRGHVEVRLRVGNIEPGRVFIPFHYGYWDNPEHMRAANELTLREWDPVSKQPHFKYAAVSIRRIERPHTSLLAGTPSLASQLLNRAKHAAEAVMQRVKPKRPKIGEYLGLLHGSERALIDALEQVARTHASEPDIRNECRLLAKWSRESLEELKSLVKRYGEVREAEPERLKRAVHPPEKPSAFGLLRDLHDCWLLANEGKLSLILLEQAAKALRDEQMLKLLERMKQQNERQTRWLLDRAKRAAPQTLTVPS